MKSRKSMSRKPSQVGAEGIFSIESFGQGTYYSRDGFSYPCSRQVALDLAREDGLRSLGETWGQRDSIWEVPTSSSFREMVCAPKIPAL